MAADRPTMAPVCAWCSVRLDDAALAPGPSRPITHGICGACAFRLIAQLGMPLAEFLDGLQPPIMMVDGDARVRYANTRARTVLGKELPTIEGALSGDVFECRHAALPGGCGHTVHCSGCTIRRTVTDTYATGLAHLRAPAVLNQGSEDAPTSASLLISTERAGNLVLLRIDAVNGEGLDESTSQRPESAAPA